MLGTLAFGPQCPSGFVAEGWQSRPSTRLCHSTVVVHVTLAQRELQNAGNMLKWSQSCTDVAVFLSHDKAMGLESVHVFPPGWLTLESLGWPQTNEVGLSSKVQRLNYDLKMFRPGTFSPASTLWP
jgi:hypothetical protein